MKFFIDTAQVEEIKEIASWGVVDGVTTNPSLIAQSGRDFKEVIAEIAGLVDGPISAEVLATTSPAMVEEARDLAAVHPNIVIKLPLTVEGLKATRILADQGIKTNLTLVFSANQALLAARAGASYVSPFLGRLDDISSNGLILIEDIVDIFAVHGLKTQIIAASVRHPIHVQEIAKLGADIATIPPAVFHQLVHHPLTDQGLEKFLQDWHQR